MLQKKRKVKFNYKFIEEPFKTPNNVTQIKIDAIFYYYLSKELKTSIIYQNAFKNHQKSYNFCFILLPTSQNLIDFKWNDRIYQIVREKAELDHALSWMSTLGGAFSALGDYFARCAEIAGKISINQMQLAFRLGDPNVAARCRLYFSLSLIQKRRYRWARRIIEAEYTKTQNGAVLDTKLVRMCKGIWAKLRYERGLYKKRKKWIVEE